MTSAKAALGDSHNFGRRVTLRGQRVIKPRSVLWEWLLLARESPLRRRLDEAARSLPGAPPEPFAFLPSLKFFDRSQAGGEVEKLRLAPLPRLSTARRGELAGIVGRALALFSWLG